MRIKYKQAGAEQSGKVEKKFLDSSAELNVILNKTYNVYGLTQREDMLWCYIIDELHLWYPIWYPVFLFDIIDNRLSRYWILGFEERDYAFLISFPEWANSPSDFYDKLTDKRDVETIIFQKYKKMIDLEYPDPELGLCGSVVEDDWVKCPKCDEAWRESQENGLMMCPKCNLLMNNPNYSLNFAV